MVLPLDSAVVDVIRSQRRGKTQTGTLLRFHLLQACDLLRACLSPSVPAPPSAGNLEPCKASPATRAGTSQLRLSTKKVGRRGHDLHLVLRELEYPAGHPRVCFAFKFFKQSWLPKHDILVACLFQLWLMHDSNTK